MHLYDHQEAEASTLYNMICTNLELYNQKLATLQNTREMIENISNSDEFNEWDGIYVVPHFGICPVLKWCCTILEFQNGAPVLKRCCNILEHLVLPHFKTVLPHFGTFIFTF